MANNIVLSDGAGNIKYQWNGTTNTLFGTTTLTGALSGTSASFSSSVTAYGNASSSSAFNLYNTTGSSGTAQYYADFGNGSGFVAGRILRGNGASGYEANGLNIDTHTGMQIKLNALGGSGGAFNVSGGNVGIGTTSPNHLLTLSATASNKTEIGLYNTFNDAANRNWAIATNQTAFGDFHLMQSNAKDGNPTSAGTSRLMINASGNVGIGTTAPGARLEVTTPTTGTEAENIRLEMNTGAIPASSGLNFRFGSVNGATIYGVGENGSTGASSMRFYTHNGTSSAERMRITSGGVVQVNNSMILAGGGSNGVISIGDTTTASNGIYINTQTFTHRFAKFSFQGNPMGEIFYNGINTTYAVSGSDFRLKKNIDKWDENVLDLFKDINPKLFNWNFQKDSDTKSKGFIAQEMTSKFPEAYHLGSDNMYLYNPSGMVVYLIKAVQELEAKIKTLETK
jgi:hypothetical protein